MSSRYYDIHSHLNHERFRDDLDQVIQAMAEQDVVTNVVGWDIDSSRRAVEISEQYPGQCRAVVGVHPDDADNFDREELAVLAVSPLVVAIGECGFDFYRSERGDLLPLQEKVFRSQIELALDHDLPVMLHVRPTENSMNAYEDTLRVLDDYPALRAHFHFFAGSKGILEAVLSSGYTVSFTGVLTFAAEYEALIAGLATVDGVLAETDAPWVAPVPYRGQRCEPWMVAQVVASMAEIRSDMTNESIYTNSHRVFAWK